MDPQDTPSQGRCQFRQAADNVINAAAAVFMEPASVPSLDQQQATTTPTAPADNEGTSRGNDVVITISENDEDEDAVRHQGHANHQHQTR